MRGRCRRGPRRRGCGAAAAAQHAHLQHSTQGLRRAERPPHVRAHPAGHAGAGRAGGPHQRQHHPLGAALEPAREGRRRRRGGARGARAPRRAPEAAGARRAAALGRGLHDAHRGCRRRRRRGRGRGGAHADARRRHRRGHPRVHHAHAGAARRRPRLRRARRLRLPARMRPGDGLPADGGDVQRAAPRPLPERPRRRTGRGRGAPRRHAGRRRAAEHHDHQHRPRRPRLGGPAAHARGRARAAEVAARPPERAQHRRRDREHAAQGLQPRRGDGARPVRLGPRAGAGPAPRRAGVQRVPLRQGERRRDQGRRGVLRRVGPGGAGRGAAGGRRRAAAAPAGAEPGELRDHRAGAGGVGELLRLEEGARHLLADAPGLSRHPARRADGGHGAQALRRRHEQPERQARGVLALQPRRHGAAPGEPHQGHPPGPREGGLLAGLHRGAEVPRALDAAHVHRVVEGRRRWRCRRRRGRVRGRHGRRRGRRRRAPRRGGQGQREKQRPWQDLQGPRVERRGVGLPAVLMEGVLGAQAWEG
mmetsp:Transcript_21941/g.67380  ORF Transcript_21941/g.67380 Transcript_21941/m.67380 type:complete len:534 (-) Transcript_21941:212-1813(-)